ncbi:putative disulfide bond formation protein B [Bartonella australis AUST/NH1]|uniref:Putative disulfide bond formation protein B n=1 Tax=Bartonella australis (strain Aust/NH1) TaxID=1094489 RepID=M1NUR7_BARAA|nr:disulfide bond formation protein B [Bartonella australis]AGF74993.1 putative disulfide bond formation protein B [Bartonella australis AUST/NH1]
MTFSPPFRDIVREHFYLKLSRKEQGLWALFLTFCLSATLSIAISFEYIGGYLPCVLCEIERFPYYGAILFSVLAIFGVLFFRRSCWVQILFLCVSISMASSLVLAVYHAGVEYGFWQGPISCSARISKLTTDINQLLNQLNSVKLPSCSQAPGRFLSLSFAGWNVVASFFYLLISLYVTSKGLLSNRPKS